jgi:hypothetical protein
MAPFSPAWQNQFGPLSHTGKRAVEFSPPSPPVAPFCFAGTEVDANLFGGTETDTNPYNGLGISGFGGTETDTNLYGGTGTDINAGLGGTQNSGCFATMQAVNITLGEFNDETINLAITNNSVPFDLTQSGGYTLNVYLKVNVGDLDTAASTKKYSSGGAISWISQAGGTAQLVIPHADLQNTNFTFWRCDVVSSAALQATAMYGTVTMKSL